MLPKHKSEMRGDSISTCENKTDVRFGTVVQKHVVQELLCKLKSALGTEEMHDSYSMAWLQDALQIQVDTIPLQCVCK